MGVYHLISISEEQLRGWPGDHDELLSNIGSAVVTACLDRTNEDVSIRADDLNASEAARGSLITVKHVDTCEADDEFSVWVWTSGNDICIADLPDEDLVLLGKLANGVLLRKSVTGDEP
jgi:hypothetical protein